MDFAIKDLSEYEDNVIFVPIGDIHIGSPECNEDYLKMVLKWGENTPNTIFLGMGDWGEFAIDPKIGLHEQIYDGDEQIEILCNLFEPIATDGRLIGLLRGNHEKRYARHRFDPMRQISKLLDAPYYEAAQNFLFKVGNQKYTARIAHGKSRATKQHTKMNSCFQMRDIVRNADMYIMGHTHALGHMPIRTFEFDLIKEACMYKTTHYILSGSYLDYGGYAEEGCMQPVGRLGSPKIKLHKKEDRISVSL